MTEFDIMLANIKAYLDSPSSLPFWWTVLIVSLILLPVTLVHGWRKAKANMTEEQRRMMQERWRETQRLSEERAIQREAEREARRKAANPVKTRLLDSGTTTQMRTGGAVHALGRAAVGNLIAGPLGALAGAATTPGRVSERREVAFKVWFEDGHTEVQVLTLPDVRYKKYLELLDVE